MRVRRGCDGGREEHLHDHRAVFLVFGPRRRPFVLRFGEQLHGVYRRTLAGAVIVDECKRDALRAPSNQGLFPALSGNQPLVPPTATSRMR